MTQPTDAAQAAFKEIEETIDRLAELAELHDIALTAMVQQRQGDTAALIRWANLTESYIPTPQVLAAILYARYCLDPGMSDVTDQIVESAVRSQIAGTQAEMQTSDRKTARLM